MVGREVRAHAAGFASLLGIAVGAIVGTIMAASAALAGEPTTRVDVTTAQRPLARSQDASYTSDAACRPAAAAARKYA